LAEIGSFGPGELAGVFATDVPHIQYLLHVEAQLIGWHGHALRNAFFDREEFFLHVAHTAGCLHDHRAAVADGVKHLVTVVALEVGKLLVGQHRIGDTEITGQQLDVANHIALIDGSDAANRFEVGGWGSEDENVVGVYLHLVGVALDDAEFAPGVAGVETAQVTLVGYVEHLVAKVARFGHPIAKAPDLVAERQQNGSPDAVVEKTVGLGFEFPVAVGYFTEGAAVGTHAPFHEAAGGVEVVGSLDRVDELGVEVAKLGLGFAPFPFFNVAGAGGGFSQVADFFHQFASVGGFPVGGGIEDQAFEGNAEWSTSGRRQR